jgi:hypothetical protein
MGYFTTSYDTCFDFIHIFAEFSCLFNPFRIAYFGIIRLLPMLNTCGVLTEDDEKANLKFRISRTSHPGLLLGYPTALDSNSNPVSGIWYQGCGLPD